MSRLERDYGVATAMCHHITRGRLLVHPKDKEELAEQGELVYQIGYRKCGAGYTGETGRPGKHNPREY